MKIKRDKRDKIFSDLVRERANWTCEHCGKYFPEGARQGLHCSHLFSRRHRSTRWHPLNAFAHCFSCHKRLGENPVEFTRWAESRLGVHVVESLRARARSIVKWTRNDLEDLYARMKDSWESMQRERSNGKIGRIEFGEDWFD